ncbi:MAG TPA: MazG family protein [Streptosporangiaceae bacterium]|nr:MazG family protein [Streptosporangiaceae bacterium]
MLTDAGRPAGRLILLATSPRVAPGLLSWQAWEALRGAARVLAGSADHPQLPALAAAGVGYEIVALPPAPVLPDVPAPDAAPDPSGGGVREADRRLARLLAEAAAGVDGTVVWLAGNGAPGRRAAGEAAGGRTDERGTLEAALRELPDGPEVAVLEGSADLPGARLLDLVATMEVLRAECPWDAKQTHESLAPHLLEEPYEALEALEQGDHAALREELGDVLLQVVFHAKVASERDDGTGFTVDDVADGIVTKLVRRHPHVFAGVAVADADEVKRNWDAIKKAERAERAEPGDSPSSVLDGVPFAQPALALAAQLQRRAVRGGVPEDVIAAARPAASGPAADQPAADLGDRLFELVTRARAAGLDPEIELRAAARRFGERVRAWEREQPDLG